VASLVNRVVQLWLNLLLPDVSLLAPSSMLIPHPGPLLFPGDTVLKHESSATQ